SAQIREILISESAWEEMTCLFAPSLVSSVIKAENFVVNRIPVLTPRVNDYPMNHQAPVPARALPQALTF
ncbi:hypothetical protein C5Y30_023070, partial [Klebsiella pneumoniae subsp. pneumoniae]